MDSFRNFSRNLSKNFSKYFLRECLEKSNNCILSAPKIPNNDYSEGCSRNSFLGCCSTFSKDFSNVVPETSPRVLRKYNSKIFTGIPKRTPKEKVAQGTSCSKDDFMNSFEDSCRNT